MRDVLIDRDALATIVAHARRDVPHECAGLLVGRAGQILEAVPVVNHATDPTRRYEISPADYLAQIRRCRRISSAQSDAFAVVGAYHSHPRSGPEPSKTDTRLAFSDFIFLIIGMCGPSRGVEIRAYAFVDGLLEPSELVVTDDLV